MNWKTIVDRHLEESVYDEQSLKAKYRFVRERDLAGIAIFLLGYDGGKLTSSLN